MSYRFTTAVFAALLIASILPAAAQTRLHEETKFPVTIKAEFIVASTSDVDAVGINFGLMPMVMPSGQTANTSQKPFFLEYATGSAVKQLYQLLTRSLPDAKIPTTFSVPAVRTHDRAPVKITVDTSIPDNSQPLVTAESIGLPQIKHWLQVQGSLTLTPRVNSDHSITLGFGLPPVLLPTITSGETLVIGSVRSPSAGSFSQNRVPSIVSIGGHMLPDTGQTLLIFITPIINGKP